MDKMCPECRMNPKFDFSCHKICYDCMFKHTMDKLLAFYNTLLRDPSMASGVFDRRCPFKCPASAELSAEEFTNLWRDILSNYPDTLSEVNDAVEVFSGYFQGIHTYFWTCSYCSKINGLCFQRIAGCWNCNEIYIVPEQRTSEDNPPRMQEIEEKKFYDLNDKNQSTTTQPRQKKNTKKAKAPKEKTTNIYKRFEKEISALTRERKIKIKELIALIDDDDTYFYDQFIKTKYVFVELPKKEEKVKKYSIIKKKKKNWTIGVLEIPRDNSDQLSRNIQIQLDSIHFINTADFLLKFILIIQ